jgi:AAA family ATP:ADP antiporter
MKLLKKLLTDPESRRHLYFFLLSYFFVLFNYPLVRASSTTMFLGEFGAKSSPAAWLITVIVLIVTIFIFNRFQARHSVQIVFLWVSILSTSIFAASTLGFQLHTRYASYFSFIWKEICIVLQVHLLLAYANNYFRKEDFKSIVGPVGAIGSIGGILGGVVTTFLGKKLGPAAVSWFSLLFVLIPAFFFLWTPELKTEGRETKESPVESLNNPDVQKYVFYISLIVMLSQFVINLADFKFNIIFEKSVHLASDRTAYLGSIYTWTNVLSLVFQFALLPFLLKKISERSLHLFIPASYLSLLVALFFSGEYALPPLAMFYIYLKATDYSLFSGGKELFYQVLSPEQKYGAKYISDMFVYRASKALIALVLIYFQSSFILNMLMIVFLFFWLVFVLKIFRFHHNFFH